MPNKIRKPQWRAAAIPVAEYPRHAGPDHAHLPITLARATLTIARSVQRGT